MARYCSDCTYLNTKKDKGKGCYECKKKQGKKGFVLGNMEACPKFEEAYARRGYDREVIYDDGKAAENKTDDKPAPILQAMILLIILIIGLLFGFIKI